MHSKCKKTKFWFLYIRFYCNNYYIYIAKNIIFSQMLLNNTLVHLSNYFSKFVAIISFIIHNPSQDTWSPSEEAD